MSKCRNVFIFGPEMDPVYPDLKNLHSSSSSEAGNHNGGFESDTEAEEGDAKSNTFYGNDLSDQMNLRRSLEFSSFRRTTSLRISKYKGDKKSTKEEKEEEDNKKEHGESSKSNIYGATIMPDNITDGPKKIYEPVKVGKFNKAQENFHVKCVRPFIYKYNVPPSEPTKWERLKYAISCPPHGCIESSITWLVSLFFFWACLVYIIFGDALPGGNIFSILILAVVAQVVSMTLGLIQVPPLLGMLLTGIVFKSVPVINVVGNSVDDDWAATLKSVALVVILIKAGLGLDPVALKKLSLVVLRLAFTPCLTEACIDAVVSHFLLGFPWKWAFIQGFVIAAISPAVVVPCLLSLSERGFGNKKGIPTLLIAGASIDDVVTITGFGIVIGLTFSTGSTLWQGIKGPLSALMGVAYGIVVGILLWYIPSKNNSSSIMFRSILIFLAGLLVIFGSKGIGYSGAGAIGCLVTTFVANIGHRSRPPTVDQGDMTVKQFFNYLWNVLAPIIFSLIGTEINVTQLDPDTISWGVLTILIGLCCRFCVAFFVVMGAGFSLKERFFIAIAWIPKATVQAAIGSQALDYARERDDDPDTVTEEEIMGQKILTVAVLAILIAAPIGAAATMISGPVLLRESQETEDEENGKVNPSVEAKEEQKSEQKS